LHSESKRDTLDSLADTVSVSKESRQAMNETTSNQRCNLCHPEIGWHRPLLLCDKHDATVEIMAGRNRTSKAVAWFTAHEIAVELATE
jgi:hypothetical protein